MSFNINIYYNLVPEIDYLKRICDDFDRQIEQFEQAYNFLNDRINDKNITLDTQIKNVKEENDIVQEELKKYHLFIKMIINNYSLENKQNDQ